MERRPPPVTIVNPSASGGTDLLDSGPDPWRPSRRQTVAVVAAVVVAALVAGLVVQVRNTRRENALDAAAVRDVSLSLQPAQLDFSAASPADVDLAVDVANQGSLPVRVVGVRLVGPSYPEGPQDTPLMANSQLRFVLPPRPCSPAVLTGIATQVEVTVRTSRDDLVVRTLQLAPEVANILSDVEQRRCGYLPPEEALQSEVLRVTRDGRDVLVTVRLSNASVQPLSLTRFVGIPGLRATTTEFPLALPERADARAPRATAEIVIRLRVTDCQAYATNAVYESTWALPVLVAGPDRGGQATIPLSGPPDAGSGTPNAAWVLFEQCPGHYFG